MQLLAILLGGATLVTAHGYIDTATIGGTNYQFYQPYSDPYASPPVRYTYPCMLYLQSLDRRLS